MNYDTRLKYLIQRNNELELNIDLDLLGIIANFLRRGNSRCLSGILNLLRDIKNITHEKIQHNELNKILKLYILKP